MGATRADKAIYFDKLKELLAKYREYFFCFVKHRNQ